MPLDPQLAVILDLIGDATHVAGLTPEEARARLDHVLPPDHQGLDAVEELSIPGPAGALTARVYRPAGMPSPAPGVVFFHGGGHVVGSIETHDGTATGIAVACGATVVSIAYRLAPEHPFPAAPDDCFAATDWVAANAGQLGIDASRVAVAGDSAGGNLAAVVALMARERGGPPLAAQLLVYPGCDHATEHPSVRENGALGYILSDADRRWFGEHYLGDADAADWRVSPLRATSLADLPPAIVVTAEFDPLRDEGDAYAQRLVDEGTPVTWIRADGMVHGFFNFPVDEAARIRARTYDALGALLH